MSLFRNVVRLSKKVSKLQDAKMVLSQNMAALSTCQHQSKGSIIYNYYKLLGAIKTTIYLKIGRGLSITDHHHWALKLQLKLIINFSCNFSAQ